MVVGMAHRRASAPAAVLVLVAMAYGALAGVPVEAAPSAGGSPAFPAIDESSLMIDPNSVQARLPGGAPAPPPAVNRAPVVAAVPPPPAPPPPTPAPTAGTRDDPAAGAVELARLPMPPVQTRGLRLPAVAFAAAELLALGALAWLVRKHFGAS